MNYIERIIWKFKKIIAVIVFKIGGKISANKLIGIKVGVDCSIYTLFDGTEPFLITIGDRVTITEGVIILTHDGATRLVLAKDGGRYYRYGRVSIESDVFVGVRSIIMPGVKIGRESIIAAGSVVVEDVPPGSVVAGVPARVQSTIQSYREKICHSCNSSNELEKSHSYKNKVISAINKQLNIY